MTMDLPIGEHRRKKTTREKLQEIIGLIYDLNEQTEFDWFCDISGHVKTVSVHYYKTIKKKCNKCGTEKETESFYLTYGTEYRLQTGLNQLIKELKTYLPEDK